MKSTPSKILFSSLFFFFVVFVLLSLIVSSLSTTFSQLFLVFSYPHRAYDFASNLLLFCFMLMCGAFVIHSIRHKRHNTTEKLVASVICVLVLATLILRITSSYMQQPDMIAYALSDTLGGVVLWKIADISTYVFMFICFIILPLMLPACKIRLNIFNKWGEWLYAYMPSINTSLFLLFAYAIQPYYGKSNPLLYIDLWLFYGGFLLVMIVLYRNQELFGFYEYANLLWLVIGVLVFAVCSKIISQADYTNTRTIFLIIGLMAWCGEWMWDSLSGNIKPSSFKSLLRQSRHKST